MKNPLLLALIASASVCAVASANTLTFDAAFPSGTTFFAGDSDEVTITYSGSNTGVFLGDATSVAVFPNDPTRPFFSVDQTGEATFKYKNAQSFLSLDWGTEDNYNRIELFLGLNPVPVQTFLGSGSGSTAFFFSSGTLPFDKIKFYNVPAQNSFEIDNVSTIAGVPDGGMTVVMLGLAMVGIAVGRHKMGALA
jgi:hypothetical protein